MALPVTHASESLKLQADAYVDLFQVSLKNLSTVIRLSPREQITWLGNIYESIGMNFQGDNQSAEGQEAKPTLTILNPAGVFNTHIQNGTLDLATVIRYRVLRSHLEADLDLKQRRMWYVGRIKDVISGQSFTVELRNMSEGPNFWIPARTFSPPDFPTVSL